MLRLFANAKYDFLALRRWSFLVSGAFILPSLVLLLTRGVNYSIEFTGGTLIQVDSVKADAATLRTALERAGIAGAEIQPFGSAQGYQIRARLSATQEVSEAAAQATGEAVVRALDTALGAGQYTVMRTEAVGPKVGRELQGKALIAILVSFAATLLYLAYRFEWRFGVGAIVATAHDIVATIAFLVYLRLEVGLVVVAAVLTVLGYSLNDTIVIFDRVRENLRKYRRHNLYEILNLSINETIPRTVLTGGTTIATALVLSFFAGAVIRPFALVMSFGIVIGTLSSMFIASPILLWIERRWPGEDVRGARALAGPGEPSAARPPGAGALPPAPSREAAPPARKPQPAR
jgi:preprotein translocase subunit SecF